jgi:excisionase family DNA binding protein
MENNNYNLMFSNYPDVVNFKQMKEMLGNIGSTLAYKLLRKNTIKSIKVGRAYKIPKNNIIEYLTNNN